MDSLLHAAADPVFQERACTRWKSRENEQKHGSSAGRISFSFSEKKDIMN
jgi:hypothetical protein